MSGDLKYTEREVVFRERAATGRALRELGARGRDGGSGLCRALPVGWAGVDAFAAELFPFPKIVCLREPVDPEPGFDQLWRWRGGVLEFRPARSLSGAWSWASPHPPRDTGPHDCQTITPKRLALWADLAANPTEEIDDDGSAPHLLGRDAT